MKLDNDALLDWARATGLCENCRQWQLRREPHHCFRKVGMGGCAINDPANIIAVCRRCHDLAEQSHAVNFDMKCIIARREKADVDDIQSWVNAVWNAPKNGPIPAKPWEQVSV